MLTKQKNAKRIQGIKKITLLICVLFFTIATAVAQSTDPNLKNYTITSSLGTLK